MLQDLGCKLNIFSSGFLCLKKRNRLLLIGREVITIHNILHINQQNKVE